MVETQKMRKPKFNLRSLRISLQYRPEILKLILKMRQCIRNKNSILKKLRHRIKEMENTIIDKKKNTETKSSQSVSKINENKIKKDEASVTSVNSGWEVDKESETKSIAEQVKEAAQDAIKQSGMVYVESAGMYYDYKTGYYYNSELGLYYHTDTECYYYYSDEKQSFVFHSYPDRSMARAQAALLAHKKKKAKKHKMERTTEEDIDNLTENLSQGGEEDSNDEKKSKFKKIKKHNEKAIDLQFNDKKDDNIFEQSSEKESEEKENLKETLNQSNAESKELEDGECSSSSDESTEDEKKSVHGDHMSSSSDDESIAKHHPPCMRVIVRETSLAKLRVGTLFIVTKDGGTIGREGDHHTILLRDNNVSRNHMVIRYDSVRKSYMATDLGSKNGSLLNGSRMSESQIPSETMQIVHGSTLVLGETKLLCHIHSGNDTCGHCEPGLLMEDLEKEKKVAYTRTCSVKKQHELELARLKNKYAPKPLLAIEETAYNDRAQARRDAVGSSHSSEKTQSSDIATSITADNKGFKLLEKMGWNKGEGLGKDSQGDTEPVPLISNEGKTGLGAIPTPNNPANHLGPATIRLASRTKMLKPPAKVFQGTFEEDSE